MSDRSLKFHLFMCANDGYLPFMDDGRKSNFVDLPGEMYAQPLLAQAQMERYLTTMAWGEHLGFDGLAAMEQRAPGFMPNVMVTCSWLLARTQRVEVFAVGPVMNTYQSPLKVAEEIAMLDVMSGGRFGVGFPLGIGTAYHHTNANPTFARARQLEGLELVQRALSEPGPFEFRGDHFHLPVVNVYPQPLRKPPMWLPAAGSRETIELAARGRYTYMAVLNPRAALIRNTTEFRRVAEQEYGYTPDRDQTVAVVHVYVAESDAQARKEFEPYLLWFNQSVMRSIFHDFFPPGYTSVSSLQAMLGSGYRSKSPSELTYDEMIDEGMAVVGTPETVIRGLERIADDLHAGQVVVMADGGAMPEWMTLKSMSLFAQEVMPHFRPPGGRPVWADEPRPGYESRAEFGARRPPRPSPALARVDGEGVIDITTAHVDDLRRPLRD